MKLKGLVVINLSCLLVNFPSRFNLSYPSTFSVILSSVVLKARFVPATIFFNFAVVDDNKD